MGRALDWIVYAGMFSTVAMFALDGMGITSAPALVCLAPWFLSMLILMAIMLFAVLWSCVTAPFVKMEDYHALGSGEKTEGRKA